MRLPSYGGIKKWICIGWESGCCFCRCFAARSMHGPCFASEIVPGQYPLLNYLSRHPDAAQQELASVLFVSPASVAQSTKRLQKAGLLEKASDPENLRKKPPAGHARRAGDGRFRPFGNRRARPPIIRGILRGGARNAERHARPHDSQSGRRRGHRHDSFNGRARRSRAMARSFTRPRAAARAAPRRKICRINIPQYKNPPVKLVK